MVCVLMCNVYVCGCSGVCVCRWCVHLNILYSTCTCTASWFCESICACVWVCVWQCVSVLFYAWSCMCEVRWSQPVWALPPPEDCAAHWKSSLTLFLCLSFSLSVSLLGRQNTNRGAAFVRHKSPLPLKLPAPLFSCPNSTAIKLSWQAFRKQLRREKDRGGGRRRGVHCSALLCSPTPSRLPPLVSSPLNIADLCCCWLP